MWSSNFFYYILLQFTRTLTIVVAGLALCLNIVYAFRCTIWKKLQQNKLWNTSRCQCAHSLVIVHATECKKLSHRKRMVSRRSCFLFFLIEIYWFMWCMFSLVYYLFVYIVYTPHTRVYPAEKCTCSTACSSFVRPSVALSPWSSHSVFSFQIIV